MICTQLQDISGFMQGGFTSLNERVETVSQHQEQLELEMKAQQEFIREQFQAFNMRFPPPLPPDMWIGLNSENSI